MPYHLHPTLCLPLVAATPALSLRPSNRHQPYPVVPRYRLNVAPTARYAPAYGSVPECTPTPLISREKQADANEVGVCHDYGRSGHIVN